MRSDLGGSTLFPSVQAERDDDARVGDARRFVTEVENMAIRARGGGPLPRLDRIGGPDRTGTAFAVVDALGRFIDIGLHPSWWTALGPAGVAAGLLEALASARMKAALVPMILRRNGYAALPEREPAHARPEGESDLRAQIADAYRLIDDAGERLREREAVRVVDGPRGLFRLHLRGGRVERAELLAGPIPGDTDRLVADARDALTEAAKIRR
ncbi:MAG TPA: hypothetical protein VFW27_29185 [Actinoplanes sp.]|nr:hypothetical protein [Actinoplanes sp.]